MNVLDAILGASRGSRCCDTCTLAMALRAKEVIGVFIENPSENAAIRVLITIGLFGS